MLTINKLFTIFCLLCLCSNREYHGSFQNKSVSSSFRWVPEYILLLAQTEGKRKVFLEWTSMDSSSKLSLTCGGNVLTVIKVCIILFRWKSTEESYLMTLKINAKFEEKLTLGSKNDMKNLVSFNASSGVWKCALWCATFVKRILCFSQKSTEELCVITLKNDAKFEEELTYALKNGMRNLANFHPTLESLESLTLTIVDNVWAKKLQRSYVSWHWKLMQYLKKNWMIG